MTRLIAVVFALTFASLAQERSLRHYCMAEQLFVPKSQDFSEPLLLPTAAQKFQARNQPFFGARHAAHL